MKAGARIAITNACRLLTAATFVLSGFVKAVDPLGTQYKINDYLEAWHLAQYVPDILTLAASVAMSTVEFGIGICLLFAIHRRATSRLLLLIMAVFTPLTLWLAIADPISDCGCFGDAIKLSNWETFWKNVVLLAFAVVLARRPADMIRFISRTNQWIVLNYSALFILAVSGYSLYYLPQFDFRPYHVGADIRKGMEIPPGAPQPQFETTFILENSRSTTTPTPHGLSLTARQCRRPKATCRPYTTSQSHGATTAKTSQSRCWPTAATPCSLWPPTLSWPTTATSTS